MKKKIVALCMVVALASVAIAGGTLAYFSDEDSKVNVMATGKVDITQNEKDRAGNDFQDQKIYPMVDNREAGDKAVGADGFFNADMANVVDKIVTVTNEEGSEPAYVRTIIAFETVRSYKEGSSTEFTDLHKHFFGVLGDFKYLDTYITVGGTEYILAVKTYGVAVAPGDTTNPSLKQFFLSPDAGNEVAGWFGEEYNILVLSQAAQTAGFVDKNNDGTAADEALNAAFGEITAANATEWFKATLPQS